MARGINDEHRQHRDADEPFEVKDCRAVAATDKALKVVGVHEDDPEHAEWIPRSQIHDDSEIYEDGHTGKLVVTGWFQRKMGWM